MDAHMNCEKDAFSKISTLSEMAPGAQCTVRKIHGKGPSYQRLLEMGLIEGTSLNVVRYAPLGDPMEVRLHGYHLSLRKAEATLVEVSHG